MAMLKVNGNSYFVDDTPDTPLLWVLRESMQLTGTKFGCGGGYCGCCTVHINGEAMRSCRIRLGDVEDAIITTIEGLAPSGDELHPLQAAWIEHQVPQCGYCQSGQLMSAAALLIANPYPSDEDINRAMDGHICRCGMYSRIRAAIKTAAKKITKPPVYDSSKKRHHG